MSSESQCLIDTMIFLRKIILRLSNDIYAKPYKPNNNSMKRFL